MVPSLLLLLVIDNVSTKSPYNMVIKCTSLLGQTKHFGMKDGLIELFSRGNFAKMQSTHYCRCYCWMFGLQRFVIVCNLANTVVSEALFFKELFVDTRRGCADMSPEDYGMQ